MEKSQALEIVSTLVPFGIIVFIIVIGVIMLTWQFRKNLFRQQLKQEALKSEHQRALLKTSIDVQEKERKRIAKDLHDELGAVLSIGRMWLIQLQERDKIDIQKINELRELLESAIASTRRISFELMPLQLSELGLEKALLLLTSKAEEIGNIRAKVQVDKDLNIAKSIDLSLYRILGELINNTLKHAHATCINLQVKSDEGLLICNYSDNGKGIMCDIKGESMGIKSIEARVSALNGTWTWGNHDHGGFYACIEVNLNEKATHYE